MTAATANAARKATAQVGFIVSDLAITRVSREESTFLHLIAQPPMQVRYFPDRMNNSPLLIAGVPLESLVSSLKALRPRSS